MSPTPQNPRFQTTRWSLVAAARGAVDDTTRAALDELVRAYWFPLYAFERRRGTQPENAEDLVQGFLASLVERDYVGDADQERGRFRTFLLAAFQNYASKERERAGAKKRGGQATQHTLDFAEGEARFTRLRSGEETPEAYFDKQWARALLDRTLKQVAQQYRGRSAEHAERFDALRPVLAGGPRQPYAEIGLQLGLSETAVKVAAHRLRLHYRSALRAEISETVERPALIDDEIHQLMAVLRDGSDG